MSFYCYRCGQRLADGARHCPACGTAVNYDESGLREDPERREDFDRREDYAGQEDFDRREDYAGQEDFDRRDASSSPNGENAAQGGEGFGAFYNRPYGEAQRTDYASYTSPARSGRDGTAVSALFCGIGSLIATFFPFLGLPLGIAGIVLGALGMKSELRRGTAIAGLVTGIIGLVLNAVILAAVVYYLMHPDLLEQLMKQAEQIYGGRLR